MKVWKILESLEILEGSMARLYETLRLRYSGNAETAAFFARLREEELSHRDIVRYQQRIMFRSPENDIDLEDYDQEALDGTRRAVEDLTGKVADLTLFEVLNSAVALESSATEQHFRSVVGRASPALGKLVQNLGASDENHAAKLRTFVHSHSENPAWWTA